METHTEEYCWSTCVTVAFAPEKANENIQDLIENLSADGD